MKRFLSRLIGPVARRPGRHEHIAWLLPTATAVLAIVAMPSMSTAEEHHGGAAHHWSYSGPGAPEHWSELDPEFAACNIGKYESPIDISSSTTSDLPSLVFDYVANPASVVDNGHTVMVSYPTGSTITVGGKRYQLKQFHFHHPSEEAIHGKRSDMVAHFVHADEGGHLAVVAVLLKQGRTNPAFSRIEATVAVETNRPQAIAEPALDPMDLLPKDRGYYTFQGSLTTPPCTEGVVWYVLKTSVEISASQLAWFSKRYPGNARPLQPLNGRRILESKD